MRLRSVSLGLVTTVGALAVPAAALSARAPIALSLSASRSHLNTTQRETLHVSGRTPAKLRLLVGLSPKPCLADAAKEVSTRPGRPIINRNVTGHFTKTYAVKHSTVGPHHVCAYLLHAKQRGTKRTIVTDAHTTVLFTTS
jgi:hypothetical protein